MRRDGGPLGKLLIERSILPDARALDDVLARQGQTIPIASLCYVLGYAPERPLIATLAAMRGVVGLVLDESVIHLAVLGGFPRDVAIRHRALPVYEDGQVVVVAIADPTLAAPAIAELERTRGRRIEPRLALEITLARTIRACYAGRAHGDSYWVGGEVMVDPGMQGGKLAVVTPDDPDGARTDDEARAHRALVDDVTKEIAVADLFLDEESAVGRALTAAFDDDPSAVSSSAVPSTVASEGSSEVSTDGASSGLDTPWPAAPGDDDDETIDLVAELDAVAAPAPGGASRVLIVDDDFATRHLLVKELQPLGYVTATAASGGEALRSIRQAPPDLVVCDVMLPEIDGFRLCRALKRSRPLGGVPVVLMSAVIDSGRVNDEVLARYGADAYLEKPLDTRRVHRVIRDLLGRRRGRPAGGDAAFARAMELFGAGDVDGAIGTLRGAIDVDPSNAKYRFVLANLLQRKALLAEAVDEYESVVQLEPDYFPALTRLAYLYYKQGMVARAVDTWRRSLPLCGDPGLRRNIELFMRKLIHEMGAVRI